jgi:peptide/nickel transport system permease protein
MTAIDIASKTLAGPRRRLRRRAGGTTVIELAAFVILAVVAVVAVLGPIVAPAGQLAVQINDTLQPPSAQHWLGTDSVGRDVFWRVVVGTRTTVGASILIVLVMSCISTVMAVAASIGPRWVDNALTVVCQLGFSVPILLLAVGVAAALGPSTKSAIVAIIVVWWTVSARLLREIMRKTMAMPFVDGARTLGVSRTRLMFRHVLPNSLDVLWIQWTSDVGTVIVLLSSLSFLGIGAQPPSAEWGAMVADASATINTAWWTALAPGLATLATAMSFGILGEWLQTRLDPAIDR